MRPAKRRLTIDQRLAAEVRRRYGPVTVATRQAVLKARARKLFADEDLLLVARARLKLSRSRRLRDQRFALFGPGS